MGNWIGLSKLRAETAKGVYGRRSIKTTKTVERKNDESLNVIMVMNFKIAVQAMSVGG